MERPATRVNIEKANYDVWHKIYMQLVDCGEWMEKGSKFKMLCKFKHGNAINTFQPQTVITHFGNLSSVTIFVQHFAIFQLNLILFQGIDFNFGDIDSNNYVFFGGLPSEYMRNLASLALPSVMFEHRLVEWMNEWMNELTDYFTVFGIGYIWTPVS